MYLHDVSNDVAFPADAILALCGRRIRWDRVVCIDITFRRPVDLGFLFAHAVTSTFV